MSDQQMTGLVVVLLGVAALIISAGTAWTLARVTRTRGVESAWFIIVVSIALFFAGVALCYFGVSSLMGV
jgi:hypothetical protein